MKQFARSVVVTILGWQTRRLRKKHDFTTVGVVGSIGKTSTKFAIAKVLSEDKRVRYQEGNYNDLVTVPLVFFGLSQPSLLNPLAWLGAFVKIERQLHKPYNYDVVVVELGIDQPGQMKQFDRYIELDIAVMTAISSEHMEYFETLDIVAKEEFLVANFSKQLVVNADLCDPKYWPKHQAITSYGETKSDYQLSSIKFSKEEAKFEISKSGKSWLSLHMEAIARSELYSANAAAVVADLLGVTKSKITSGIKKIQPVSGRMQRLKGIKDSIILDETYNASPLAVMAALDSLYQFQYPHKIAVLGNMNELGSSSEQEHTDIGNYCEPDQLDLVVTIGPDANDFLAPAAEKKGCKVIKCRDPYQAADAVRGHIQKGSVVLVKGSQNNVYAEEAVKMLLANPEDARLLVRQSKHWMSKKKANFS